MGVATCCRGRRWSALRTLQGATILVVLVAAVEAARAVPAEGATPNWEPAAVLQELHRFRELGTVLLVAAHPDDENTQLITYFARGRGCRTAYLSITRGDGGQNLLGPEFGEQLGVIRTQELLAARRIDGGRQFFTRAIDFGFSKSDRETLNIWDHQAVLGDVVRVIRKFRPDVVITRFSPQPGRTHGHHTASAILAVEAFNLAGDPQAFPEQLGEVAVWQPKRILHDVGRFGRGDGSGSGTSALNLEIGGVDPVLGISFGEIAGRSRAMHKCQGFGEFAGGGGAGPRTATLELLAGEPATKDVFDGVDTSWRRFEHGAEVERLTDRAIADFDSTNLAANVPVLLQIRQRLATLPRDPLVQEKSHDLDRILQACLGLSVKTVVPEAEKVPGETLEMWHSAVSTSTVPIRWVSVRYPVVDVEFPIAAELKANEEVARGATQKLPTGMPLSQPYWLREPGALGMFRVDEPTLIGTPENAPEFPCEYIFEIEGQTLTIADEPVQLVERSDGEPGQRTLAVIPPAWLKFTSEVALVHPANARDVDVVIEAARPEVTGDLQLNVPEGWHVTPAGHAFNLARVGDTQRVSFRITAPPRAETAEITAAATIQGARFDRSKIEIQYDHIPRQLLQPQAQLKAVSLDWSTRGKRVGYIAGAGDSVAESLQQMGYDLTQLSGSDLTAERLQEYDAVVIGIRALNTREDLADHMANLFAYVEAGGNVIVQYNRPNGLRVREPAPYELRLSGDRVTDEQARVHLLAPNHPALNSPNKISEADFTGWVQERGLYFPNQWDSRFIPLIACHDPGEPPLEGGLLVAQHGKGYFVYTSLAWFRQLPAGVPGAYRLFANLVSLGK